MLSQEQKYFIQIISNYLQGEKSVCSSDINWQDIKKYALKHQVNGIVFSQCNQFMDDRIKDEMFNYSAIELCSYSQRVALYKMISDKFSAEKINFFSVKGLNVSKYYPMPQHRTMGDCDVLVAAKDLKRAEKTMEEMQFSRRQTPSFESIYEKNGLMFEIHYHLLYDEVANKKEDKIFGDAAWKHTTSKENSTEKIIDESFHFVYLLLHLKKHLIHKGVGFRQFIDIYVTATKAQLDWNYINRELQNLGLLKFAQVCGALTVKWFARDDQSNSPYGFKLAKIDDTFYEIVTKKIFDSGIFGTGDKSNKHNALLQKRINQESYSAVQYLAAKIRVVFPTYNDIRFAPKYSFVNRKPWLLPVAWIYRIILVILGKTEHSRITTEHRNNMNDMLKKRKNLLKRFGLL